MTGPGGLRQYGLVKVCHRYGVESAAGQLGMGRVWGKERAETLRRVRSLPTYDAATDTVVVCRYVEAGDRRV